MDYLAAPERIETQNYIIRSYRPGDGRLQGEAVTSSYDHLKTYMAWAKPVQTIEESENLCRQMCGKYLLATDFTMGIFTPTENLLLGGTGFHLRGTPLTARTAEIGMWIRGDQAGKGLGTAVLKTMLQWGFAEWPWLRLFWRCDEDNFASARTAEKAGMLKEGCLRSDDFKHGSTEERRSTLFFGTLKSEWKQT